MPPSNFRFKVRASKEPLKITCGPELTALLSCFATTGDLRHTAACANSAQDLHRCMGSAKGKVVKKGSSINYLLGKVRR